MLVILFLHLKVTRYITLLSLHNYAFDDRSMQAICMFSMKTEFI